MANTTSRDLESNFRHRLAAFREPGSRENKLVALKGKAKARFERFVHTAVADKGKLAVLLAGALLGVSLATLQFGPQLVDAAHVARRHMADWSIERLEEIEARDRAELAARKSAATMAQSDAEVKPRRVTRSGGQ